MDKFLTVQLLLIVCLSVITCHNKLAKRDVHRIILREEVKKPRPTQRHNYDDEQSSENYSEYGSYESEEKVTPKPRRTKHREERVRSKRQRHRRPLDNVAAASTSKSRRKQERKKHSSDFEFSSKAGAFRPSAFIDITTDFSVPHGIFFSNNTYEVYEDPKADYPYQGPQFIPFIHDSKLQDDIYNSVKEVIPTSKSRNIRHSKRHGARHRKKKHEY